MLKLEKQILSKKLKSQIYGKEIVIVSHGCLPFSTLDDARRKAPNNTKLIKIKNTIAKHVLGSDYATLHEHLKGETLIIAGDDIFDSLTIANTLMNASKNVQLIAASAVNDPYTSKSLIILKKYPSKKALQSSILNAINGIYAKILRMILAKVKGDNNG